MQNQSKSELRSAAQRFTMDGSDALELRLADICGEVLDGVQSIVPQRTLEGLVLGGGYGRGEGGVLKTQTGDEPYNDMEFYVFVSGNRFWLQRKYGQCLETLANRLSSRAGLHIEFKIDSLNRLRQSSISMFSYDLLAGHRIVYGPPHIFDGCQHHLDAARIPALEATRLLFNRCSGLLLAKELLRKSNLAFEESDFVARNLAKAQLGLGDAVLTACAQYHWSCLERNLWLKQLTFSEPLPWLSEIRAHHDSGIAFKLHPQRRGTRVVELKEQHQTIKALALQVWLWLEARRLNCAFTNAREYAFNPMEKCSGTSVWKNVLSNLRVFGLKAVLDAYVARYPRERLFNALALLLWDDEALEGPRLETRHVQKQLRTQAGDWGGLLQAYKQIWPSYG